MRRLLVGCALAGAALGGGVLSSASHAAASPSENGCPSAFEPKTLEEWTELGYLHAPGRVDEAGNNDGITCGKEMPDGYRWGYFIKARGVEPQAEVAQLFVDNDRPPAER